MISATVSLFLLTLFVLTMSFMSTDAFVPVKHQAFKTPASKLIVSAKKPVEDLSFIESRDMTREEMLELNKKNEEIMNMELQMMTAFSLVISIPILYLCWVAFFSD